MFINANYNYNNQQSFTAISKKKLETLAKIIEDNNQDYTLKAKPVAEIYQNGLKFLKGEMPKNKYVKKLDSSLDKFYELRQRNSEQFEQLTEKERAFLNNASFSLETYFSRKKITKEQLANFLSILA